MMQNKVMVIAMTVIVLAIFALALIISMAPLNHKNSKPLKLAGTELAYTSMYYMGWTIATAVALVLTGSLPLIAWFRTYKFTASSAICIFVCVGILCLWCAGSYIGLNFSNPNATFTTADFLGVILPPLLLPAFYLIGIGVYKLWDDNFKVRYGTVALLGGGGLFLLGAVVAISAKVHPWTVGVELLLSMAVISATFLTLYRWASNNFYLTVVETSLLFLALLALSGASVIVGIFSNNVFVGASVGYFLIVCVLAARSAQVLLSPPVLAYSPRILPVFIYKRESDKAVDVSFWFITGYAANIATIAWAVVATRVLYPPYAGPFLFATCMVGGFGFAASRPRKTMLMTDDALKCLRQELVMQAIIRSAGGGVTPASSTLSSAQRSLSSNVIKVLDPSIVLDRAHSLMPQADLRALRKELYKEVLAAGFWCHNPRSEDDSAVDPVQPSGPAEMPSTHKRLVVLEEAIDREYHDMWAKFGGYLLCVLGLAARAQHSQDEARLRKFLKKIGFDNLSVDKIKKWSPMEIRQFEAVQERYMLEKEMEEDMIQKRREEEMLGKWRRQELLEKEERRRREMEASVSSDSGQKWDGSSRVAYVQTIHVNGADSKKGASSGGKFCSEDFDYLWKGHPASDGKGTMYQDHLLQNIRKQKHNSQADQVKIPGTVCVVGMEPHPLGRVNLPHDSTVMGSAHVTLSMALLMSPHPGPVCVAGFDLPGGKGCLEFYITPGGLAEMGGRLAFRYIQMSDSSERIIGQWTLGTSFLPDRRWHNVALTLEGDTTTAIVHVDGQQESADDEVDVPYENGIIPPGTAMYLGTWPDFDQDCVAQAAQLRPPPIQVTDVFLWGRSLSDDEIMEVHSRAGPGNDGVDTSMTASSTNLKKRGSGEHRPFDESEEDLTARKKKAPGVAVDITAMARKLTPSHRGEVSETTEEINAKMRAVEAAVRDTLAAQGEKRFLDSEFPPDDSSLFIQPMYPLPKLQVVKKWLRPDEMLQRVGGGAAKPYLFHGKPNPSDVCQGRLGDCWFLSAVAVLTEASYINQVIITPEYNEEGIYTVRFCIQGEWQAVVVDDLIPCDSKGRPTFGTSKKGYELWVMMLEKAYAKLHGSYEALEGGVVQDALVDMTGGAGEEIDFTSPEIQLDLASGRLWSQVTRFKQEGFLLGAGSPSGSDTQVSANGIVQGHAYAILQVREVEGHKLLQIRNPWANEVEWNGPWCDSSPEWNDRMKHKLKYIPQASDGIFWMAWEDFQLHFRSLYVCRVYPPEERTVIRGEWIGGNAGGCSNFDTWHRNPQFVLRAVGPDARQPMHVFMTLTQGVHASAASKGYVGNYQSSGSAHFYIGLRIIRRGGKRAEQVLYAHEVVGGSEYVNTREVACEITLEPDPKGYTIVPSSYAPGEEAPFLLSVFTKAHVVLEPLQQWEF